MLLFKFGVLISSLFITLLIKPHNFLGGEQTIFQYALSEAPPKPISGESLCEMAKPITVKVLGVGAWGSGILVQRQGALYSVVTNNHVLKGDKEIYQVQTVDGKIHQATVKKRFEQENFPEDDLDLAILQFNDPYTTYQIAKIGRWKEGEKVLAAGFPVTPEPSHPQKEFFCTKLADVSRKLDASMKQGYQLGYYQEVRNGMSGGPLVNDQGQLIGINGKRQPAIFVNRDLYLYRDGSQVSESLDLLSRSSWAIPIETVANHPDLSFLNITLESSLIAICPTLVPTPSISVDFQSMAQEITVLFCSPSSSDSSDSSVFNGSGVIIARPEELTYYVLTNENVISNQEEYEIITYDGSRYKGEIVSKDRNLNLAILQFTSSKQYKVASLGNSHNLEFNNNVYVAGWSIVDEELQFVWSYGQLKNRENLDSQEKLNYTNETKKMDSGLILDQWGKLIGIHQGIGEGIPLKNFQQMALPQVIELTTKNDSTVKEKN